MKTDRNGTSIRPTHPDRHFRLVCWWLLYRVPIEKVLTRNDETGACNHAKLNIAVWDAAKGQWPREWAKLLAKRQRRSAWYREHGSIRDGWTPPDPADPRRTANKPLGAYLARRGLTLDQFYEKYSRVPFGPKKGGKQANWDLILKINAWQEPKTALTDHITELTGEDVNRD